MEDHTVNLGLNLALGLSSMVVKSQPADPDTVKSDGDNVGPVWPLTAPLQKVEREDSTYGDGDVNTSHSSGHDVNTFADFQQLPSKEIVPTMSEDEIIAMYNDEESRELAKGKMIETGEPESMAVASVPQDRPSSSIGTKDDLMEKEIDQGNSNLPSVVTMVDNFIVSDDDRARDASNEKRVGVSSDLTRAHSPSAALSDEQRSVDEIEVVEERFDDFEEGEVIKEFAQTRHGTNSETFLSQMHFFGGRTWARGRGRRGRSRGRDITNIALKLIETDQAETDGEHSNSVEEMDKLLTVTNSVCSGMGKSSGCPSLPQRKSERVPAEPRVADISSFIEAEQPSASSSFRREAARGRGRAAWNKGYKAKQSLVKSKSRTQSATDGVDDVDYESSDEDTLAAIRASLEEMNENNNKGSGNSTKDEGAVTTEDHEKEGNNKKSDNMKKVDSLKKDSKTNKSADSSRKGNKATANETLMKAGKEKKASSTEKADNLKKMESNKKSSDQSKFCKAAGSGGKGQNSAKKSRGRPLIDARLAEEPANNTEPEEEVMYESNDEDTQAAIRASLEELQKEKQRQKERDLGKQKTCKKLQKKGKWSKQKKSLFSIQSTVTGESSSQESIGKNSSPSAVARTFGFQSKTKPKVFRRGERHSSRLSLDPEPSTSGYKLPSVKKQAASPGSQDPDALDGTPQKMEKINVKLKSKIKSSVNHEGKKKEHSSDISDFDTVVDSFLQVEESPDSMSSSIIHRRERKWAAKKRKSRLNDSTSSSVDINVESDGEKMDPDSHAMPTNEHLMVESSPHVKLKKLDPIHEHAPSQCSSRSATKYKKRAHDDVDGDYDIASSRSKLARKQSIDHQCHSIYCAENAIADKVKVSSSQHSDSGRSITAITPSLDAAGLSSSEQKDDSLTKSVGGMMSYLFGDKLAEECPNGFVVNVRLEVEKKKEDDDRNDNIPNQC